MRKAEISAGFFRIAEDNHPDIFKRSYLERLAMKCVCRGPFIPAVGRYERIKSIRRNGFLFSALPKVQTGEHQGPLNGFYRVLSKMRSGLISLSARKDELQVSFHLLWLKAEKLTCFMIQKQKQ